MRTLRIVFTTAVILTVLALVASLIAREVLLTMAINQVRADVRKLSSLSAESSFSQSCREFGGVPPDGVSLTRAQLRFTSPRDYVLEIVCQTNESLRSTVRAATLPKLVEKGVGQSGLIQGRELNGLTLAVLGRTGAVYEEDTFIRTVLKYNGEPQLITDQGPPTLCEGYDFSCCSETAQQGVEPRQPAALDCPRSCYVSCVEKPVILNFASDPLPTVGTRKVTVEVGQPVEFFYTFNDVRGDAFTDSLTAQEQASLSLTERFNWFIQGLFHSDENKDRIEKVTINFGDGQFTELTDLHSTISHTYTCTRVECIYQVTIQAVTENGTVSSLTESAKLELHVIPK